MNGYPFASWQRARAAGLAMTLALRAVLSAIFMLATVSAMSCRTHADATKSERHDSASTAGLRLRFETVRSILEDSRDNYWFGSWNEGVARFDGKSLRYFTSKDGLSSTQIRAIQEDRNGVVWFEGGFGLTGFDGRKLLAPANRNYDSKDQWQLAAGDLWFKEDGGTGATAVEARPGAYRYDGRVFTYLAYPVPAHGAPPSTYATTGIARGKSGRVWFATYNAVFRYDGKPFTVFDDQSLGLDDSTGTLHVRCVFEDSKGNLWIGNNGIGVILHDGRTATRFTQEKGLGKRGPHGGRTIALPGATATDCPEARGVRKDTVLGGMG